MKTYPILDFIRKYWMILVALTALVSQGAVNHYMIIELKEMKIKERLISLETKMEYLVEYSRNEK